MGRSRQTDVNRHKPPPFPHKWFVSAGRTRVRRSALRNDPAAAQSRLRRRTSDLRYGRAFNGEGDRASAVSISNHADYNQSWLERLRLRAESARQPFVPMSGSLL